MFAGLFALATASLAGITFHAKFANGCLCGLVGAIVVSFAAPSVAQPFPDNRLPPHVRNVGKNQVTEIAPHAWGPAVVSAPLILVSDESDAEKPDAIIFASMSGKCSTLKIAGQAFACRAVAFSQTEEGRANFIIAIEDPDDDSHIVTFSGNNGRRTQDNLYELPIDRMLLKSKERPRVDGLPVPSIKLAAGICKLNGSFASAQVSSISCSAVLKTGERYELQYETMAHRSRCGASSGPVLEFPRSRLLTEY